MTVRPCALPFLLTLFSSKCALGLQLSATAGPWTLRACRAGLRSGCLASWVTWVACAAAERGPTRLPPGINHSCAPLPHQPSLPPRAGRRQQARLSTAAQHYCRTMNAVLSASPSTRDARAVSNAFYPVLAQCCCWHVGLVCVPATIAMPYCSHASEVSSVHGTPRMCGVFTL